MPQQVDIVPEESLTDGHKNLQVKRQVTIYFLSFLSGTLIGVAYLFLHFFIHLLLPSFFIIPCASIVIGTLLSVAAILADVHGRLWLYQQRVGIEQGWRYKVLRDLQVCDASIMPINYAAAMGLQEYVAVDPLVKCYLLLGAAGSGKTKTLSYLMQCELENHLKDMSRNDHAIPIFISLKDYSDFLKANYPLHSSESSAENIQPDTLYDYLSDSRIKSLQYLHPYLLQWINEKKVWFLFDGLNEIDTAYQSVIYEELMRYIEWTKNVIITCREIDYHENPLFAQLSVEGHANLIIMKPLEEQEQDAFIRSHIEKGFVDEHGKRWASTSEHIIDFIEEKQLRSECRTPKNLFMLMQKIDGIGITSEINTLGQLLHEWVSRRIEAQLPVVQEPDFDKNLIYYIGEIACTMRLMKCVSGLSLGTPSVAHHKKPYLAWAEEIEAIIAEQRVKDPSFIDRAQIPTNHPFTAPQREQMLHFAAEAGLLSISANSILDFDSKLTAEYFVAEFLQVSDTGSHLPYEKELIGTEGDWSEPIHIWAGLLDDPMLLADRFGELGITCKDERDDRRYNALTSGLMCMGVKWIPDREQELPDSLYDLFVSSLANEDRRKRLIAIYKRRAQEGSDTVYRPLLKLLTVKGAEELLFALPRSSIRNLLFEYLDSISENPSYEQDVEALEHILGRMRDVITFHLALIRSKPVSSQPPERFIRLRQAAISILGKLRMKEGIGDLLDYLSEPDTIKEKAIEALCRMKLDDVRAPLLNGLKPPTTTAATERKQLAILRIVETFLKSAGTIGNEDIVKQLLHNLSPPYQLLHENVKRLLLEEAASTSHGEAVRKILVAAFVSPNADQIIIRNVREILIKGNEVATILSDELKKTDKKVSDDVKIRIIEVLGKTQDHHELDTLYSLMAYNNPPVRGAVALALSNYTHTKVVTELIKRMLSKPDDDEADAYMNALLMHDPTIMLSTPDDDEADAYMNAPLMQGSTVVELICAHLTDHALPGRTNHLIQLLQHFKDRKAIPALNSVLSTQPASLVALEIIKTLQLFNSPADDKSVVVLLQVLKTRYKDKAVYDAASEALCLYGEPILPTLLSELENAQPAGSKVGIMKAISMMQPFPYQSLLNAFRSSSNTQTRLIGALFISKEEEGTRFLAKHFCHSESSIRNKVRTIFEEWGKDNAKATIVIEPLLDQLSRSDCRNDVVKYLRDHERVAIHLLANRLGDEHGGRFACDALIEMDSSVIGRLPALITALNHPQDSPAFRHVRQVLLGVIDRQHQMSPQIVDLFLSLTDQGRQQAHDALVQIISDPPIPGSIPVLLQSLASEHLAVQQSVIECLVKIGRDDTTPQSKTVSDGLVAALREEEKRPHAAQALKGIGENAVPGVYTLILDNNQEVRKSAHDIMRAMGKLVFARLSHALRDNRPELREAAKAILNSMPPEAFKDASLQLLASKDSEQFEQGQILLFERVQADVHVLAGQKKMLTVLLEHIQTQLINQQTLPVIAFLLSLPDRQEMLDALVEVLGKHPQTQPWLSPLFLLLALEGGKARDSLLQLIQKGNMSRPRHEELMGILGILEPHQLVTDLARSIGKHAQSFQNALALQQIYEVELSHHALGGLLIGGHWDTNQLLKLKSSVVDGSAQHELFSVLLGDSYLPRIETLQKNLANEKAMRVRESQGQQSIIVAQKEEIDGLHAQIEQKNDALRQDNDELREAHTSLREKDGRIIQLISECEVAQLNASHFDSEAKNARKELTDARDKNTLLYGDLQKLRNENKNLADDVARLRFLSGGHL